ncbi:TNK1 isoform 3, partial [Pongo abelii]
TPRKHRWRQKEGRSLGCAPSTGPEEERAPGEDESSPQPSQPPRERLPWPKRKPPHNHPMGTPGASKAAALSGGLLPDPELQRKI